MLECPMKFHEMITEAHEFKNISFILLYFKCMHYISGSQPADTIRILSLKLLQHDFSRNF